MATRTGATTTHSYDDFEPLCNWVRGEDHQQTLVIHVPDFKRDQLKVHVSNHGVLKISGEHPIDKSKRSRFIKEVNIPNECDPSKIQAKISGGRLHIIMPNKTRPITKKDQPEHPSDDSVQPTPSLPPQTSVAENSLVQSIMLPTVNNMAEPGTKSGRQRVNLHIAVAIVAVLVGVSLGAYATVKYILVFWWHQCC